MGTHINAFHAEVEAKKQNLAEAQSAFDEAQAALKAHPDYRSAVSGKFVTKDEAAASPATTVKETSSPKRDSKGHFVKS